MTPSTRQAALDHLHEAAVTLNQVVEILHDVVGQLAARDGLEEPAPG
jgi:hypothetical protein